MADEITVDLIETLTAEVHLEVNGIAEVVTKTMPLHHNGHYVVPDPELIPCKGCGSGKAKSEYYSSSRNGIRQPCKPCQREARRASYRSSDEADRVWERNLARYGLTPADYDRMLAEQDGRCATCQRAMNWGGKRLCVDHDHATGQVRQLLCSTCNTVIGFIEKHDVPFDALVAYLARFAVGSTGGAAE